jgi:hypothetical protein
LNPWVIGGAILVGIVLLGTTLALLWFTRPQPAAAIPGTAVLNVISVPTRTPIPLTPTLPAGISATPSVPPSPPAGTIALGAQVEINGTGGDGLRLRADPGLEGKVRFLALEGEIFQVKDGPQALGGYTWWFLVAPYDEKVQGWAVENYLKPVSNP